MLRNFSSNVNIDDDDDININYNIGSKDVPIIIKNKEVSLYLSPQEMFEKELSLKKLSELCEVNGRYSVLTRVCYIDSEHSGNDDVTDWKTLGEQIYKET